MSTILMLVCLIVILVAALGLLYWRRRPRDLKPAYFQTQWHNLQVLLKDKRQWPDAVAAADKLLDQALKKKHVSGKNMGERLVKAQRMLTDNDGVWFGHKLRGQLEHDQAKKLKETDVKDALLGIRQALKDLGALPESKATPAPKIPAVPVAAPTPTPAPKAKPKPTPKPKKSSRGRV